MRLLSQPLIRFIFFGNYFYGVCAIALAFEAGMQQQIPLNHWSFYLLLFSATVWYYTHSYQHSNPEDISNKRIVWYFANKKLMGSLQWLHLVLAIGSLIILSNRMGGLISIQPLPLFMLFIFPLVAALYYGADQNASKKFNLRQLGRLKPLIIGFSWAGPVTVYPVIFSCLESHVPYGFTLVGSLLFLKNFMFIAMLSIMFDIKDYAHDHQQSLGTFVARAGLRKTIFTILVPLSFLGLGTFVIYGITREFSVMKIALNTMPFLLLMLVAWSLAKRRHILYYLIVVDGLMVVKAICGTIAMMYL